MLLEDLVSASTAKERIFIYHHITTIKGCIEFLKELRIPGYKTSEAIQQTDGPVAKQKNLPKHIDLNNVIAAKDRNKPLIRHSDKDKSNKGSLSVKEKDLLKGFGVKT